MEVNDGHKAQLQRRVGRGAAPRNRDAPHGSAEKSTRRTTRALAPRAGPAATATPAPATAPATMSSRRVTPVRPRPVSRAAPITRPSIPQAPCACEAWFSARRSRRGRAPGALTRGREAEGIPYASDRIRLETASSQHDRLGDIAIIRPDNPDPPRHSSAASTRPARHPP
jgi:hypothetical protein